MVIINKFVHTQRKTVKNKKSFVSVLAIVLSLLITMSVILVAVPTASAKGESAFQDNECIYIDCRQQMDGKYWDSDSAELRVFTYYNDSDDLHFCHEFEENFQNNGWFVGSNVLQKGIKADKFADHIYRFRIPSDKISHVRIARTNSGATNVWNLSKYMWNNTRSFTAGSKSNCIKITGWGEGYDYNSSSWSGSSENASWSNFTPAQASSYNSKSANLDSSITSDSSLYPITAKYYDYYNDDEIQNGWGNINYNSNHGSVHYTKNNSWYWWDGYWEPFSYLNNKIASKGGNYPLYFGNFYGKSDGYTGEGSSNLVSFNNQANNSNNISGNHNSVEGLTGGTLSNDNIVYATSNGYNSSTVVPFFDDTFLSSNGVGSVINSAFPMRKVIDDTSGIITYTFDSKDGADNVWIDGATGSSPTVKYAYNSYKAKDSLYSYSTADNGGVGGQASGYGFFPFDGNRNSGEIDAKNYGFGLRVDVPFNLGSEEGHIGQLLGKDNKWYDQEFNFTGDDDVWVYVDGKLILDLGGDHKRTVGSINFHTKEVKANIGATFNNATRNQSGFTLNNEDDPTAEHTLTMFYVERGMIESNLSFDFNFAPVANQLITEKIVNTTELNDGIKNAYALKNADEFTFTSSQLNGKDYTYAHTNAQGVRSGTDKKVSNSAFNLRDQDTATFNDQLEVTNPPTQITVVESFPSSNALTYDKTSWIVVDTNDNNYVIAQSAAGTDQSLTSQFNFKTHKTGQFDPTKLKLTYTNTPKKADVVIKKNIVDSNENDVDDDDTEFTATVLLSFDKGSTYNAYPLKYFIKDNSTEQTMSGGQVTLQEGKDITIKDLPVGTYVKVTENASSLNGYTDTTGEVVLQVEDSGASTTITNKQPAPGEITKTITAQKKLDGQDYSGSLFKFCLEGLNIPNDPAANAKDTTGITPQQKITVSDGTVTFDALTFDSEGVYRYFVYEDTSYLAQKDSLLGKTYAIDISQTSSNFVATITVTRSGVTLTASNPVFTRTTKTSASEITAADLSGASLTTATFTNVVQKGSITINKTNQAGENVSQTTFTLYKVDEDFLEEIDGMSDIDKYDAILALDNSAKVSEQTTNGSGIAEFNDLLIYEDGYTSSSQPAYQNYCLIESANSSGYNLNKTPHVFKFPTYDQEEEILKYHYEFDYVNGKLRMPDTAGSGMTALRYAGMFIVGMSLLTLAGFVLYRKRLNKSYSKAKHYK